MNAFYEHSQNMKCYNQTVVGDCGTTKTFAVVCNELALLLPLKWFLQQQGPGLTTQRWSGWHFFAFCL